MNRGDRSFCCICGQKIFWDYSRHYERFVWLSCGEGAATRFCYPFKTNQMHEEGA